MHMREQKPGWILQETRGQPFRVYGREITPIGRLRQVRWPGGGLIWHRPAAIEVRQGEALTRLPIVNLTRRLNAIFLANLLLTALLLTWMQQRRRRRERSNPR